MSSTSKICDIEICDTVEVDRECEYTVKCLPIGCCYAEIRTAEVSDILSGSPRQSLQEVAR
jgi:hypothetical protein